LKSTPKKILIITYYWPPSGGSGVQRWVKFVKYLVKNGWDPIIYTPENPEYPSLDNSLLNEIPKNITVIKTPIWEPFNLYKKIANRKNPENINAGFLTEHGKKNKWIEALSIWIRGNFFIPDARKYWIKPSIKFLNNYLNNNSVDLIVSTGPPHSMHMIAQGVKKKTGIPWLADFRDPWTNIDFYSDLKLTRFADRKHRRQEKNVLRNADQVVCVGETMAEEMRALGAKRVAVITNGYDTSDILTSSKQMDEDKFSIVHIGTLNRSRNPEILWQALEKLVRINPNARKKLEIKLVGKVDINVKNSIKSHGLEKFLNLVPYIEHKDAVHFQAHASILLLLINNTPNAKGILTGKMFEYLGAKRPILSIGPLDGDASKIIRSCKAGSTFDYKDSNGILNFLNEQLNGNQAYHTIGHEKYSRENLTKDLIDLFNSMLHELQNDNKRY
jgi:glycosyltransferase involved in cell wall biosynthesis